MKVVLIHVCHRQCYMTHSWSTSTFWINMKCHHSTSVSPACDESGFVLFFCFSSVNHLVSQFIFQFISLLACPPACQSARVTYTISLGLQDHLCASSANLQPDLFPWISPCASIHAWIPFLSSAKTSARDQLTKVT